MENYFIKTFYRQLKFVILFAIVISGASSCRDLYPLDNTEPDFLGGSIYEYLNSNGHYKNYVRLINDLNYAEVLNKTGSKTLFASNDSAFTQFFKGNEWNVSSYEQLTLAQKKLLFNYSLINNAYTSDMYSNFNNGGILYEGTAMRRQTALQNIDSICFEKPEYIPDGPHWKYYKSRGMYMIKDQSIVSSVTNIPTVFITQSLIDKYGLTDEDFSVLTNGRKRSPGDIFVFDNKVIKQNIRCKNGYIHLLDKVLVPRVNMAEYINKNFDTKIFSKLLERFSLPKFDPTNTLLYKQLHTDFTDSIFSKTYYSSLGGESRKPTDGVSLTNVLPYNPGWNSYQSNSGLQSDMAAMFVPSDQAMTDYFNSGIGEILKSRFGTWENVPDEIILPFIKRHMRSSLIESVPSKFSKMVDGENYRLPVEKNHIEKSYMGVNGQVYVTNTIYPPVDYISVYSPVLMSSNSKIMNWAINISQVSVDNTPFAFYKLYLNSLVSKYSLFVPTDEYFSKYVDPIAYGQDVQGVLKFWFNPITSAVNATVYKYNKTGIIGDSVDVITSPSFLQNRLWSLLDSHIVIGDVEATGSNYAITKANDIIKISGSGNSLSVQGGEDMLNNTSAKTTKVFHQYNGTTYFIDKPIDPALRSVYKVLSNTPEFSMFSDLLKGVPQDYVSQIFAQQGVDYRVIFFNAFRYTIYVPSNDAITAAITTHRMKTWDEINSITDAVQKTAAIEKMVRLLKYHFQDNAVFSDQTISDRFQSSTIKTDTTTTYWKTAKTKYYKIGIVGDGNTLHLTADTRKGAPACVANVTTDNSLRNIIVKDYIFSALPSKYKNVDGTGNLAGTAFSTSTITSSASSVIHQIDNVLTIEQ
ncbi:MAG: fasciclin domain-containing protein [Paludibacter sp.]|nr:fasciclin domain-containing protein [Paludibacter sp.]